MVGSYRQVGLTREGVGGRLGVLVCLGKPCKQANSRVNEELKSSHLSKQACGRVKGDQREILKECNGVCACVNGAMELAI